MNVFEVESNFFIYKKNWLRRDKEIVLCVESVLDRKTDFLR
jgi:hypothetical protein